MFVSSQNPYTEILIPKDTGVRRWDFHRCMSHEGEVLNNWIGALIRENAERSLAFFHHAKTPQEATIYEPESELLLDSASAGALILDF